MVNGSLAPDVETGISEKDTAETFAESDVTLSQTYTEVSSESVGLQSVIPADRADDDNTAIQNTQRGVVVNFDSPTDQVTVTISANTQDVGQIRVKETNGTLIQEQNNGLYQAGDTETFTALGLSANTDYAIACYRSGNNYTQGYVTNPSLPYEGYDSAIVNGWYNGFKNDNPRNISIVETPNDAPTSGSVFIEWPEPADVYKWDAASFQATLANESVDVFVEESTDGGSTWTEVAGPIKRGDDIPVASDNRMRFRVDLTRSDTTNNPTLDAMARRYIL